MPTQEPVQKLNFKRTAPGSNNALTDQGHVTLRGGRGEGGASHVSVEQWFGDDWQGNTAEIRRENCSGLYTD